MHETKRLLGLLLAIGVVGACSGPAPTPVATESEPVRGGTVVIGGLGDVLSWNPYLAEDQTTVEILALIYPSLAIEQADYQDHPPSFAPYLADSWELSADQRELTFHLNQQARWSDGVPVTADDVVFAWTVQRSPEIGWLAADSKDSIVEVTAIDPHTVRFRFDRVYPYQLMDANDGPIIPAHSWSEIPLSEWRSVNWADHAVSAGPFRKGVHRPQQELVLERSDDYWKPNRPFLDRVVWRPMASRTGLLAQVLSGGVDVVNGIDPADGERIDREPRLHLVSYPDRGYSQIRWNLRRALFEDRTVRRALTMAIDRESIVEVVYNGHARTSVGPVLSTMWAFNRALQPLPFDPAAARELLAAAGWLDHDGDGVLDREGERFSFELLTNSENDQRQDICVLVQQYLARVGIEAELRFTEWGTMLALESNSDFDAIVSSWIEPTLIDLAPLWHTAPPEQPTLNTIGYSNDDVDALLEQAATADSFEQLDPLYDRIQELIVADQPYTFLAETERLVGVNNRVHGAVFNAASPYINLDEWWVTGE